MERIVLDPDLIAEDRVELEITSWIKAEGVDWGDSEIEAYMSDHLIGSSPVDYRLPNRKVQMPLTLRAVGGTSFATVRSAIQQKAARYQQESGWLMREMDGQPLFCDVENATLHLGGGVMQAYRNADVDATLALECLPDFYGNVATIDTVAGTGTLTSVLRASGVQAVVAGHYPGRIQMIPRDTTGADRHGLLWGFRARYYPLDGTGTTTAALALEAEAMTAGGSYVGRVARTGASGGTVMRGTLSTSWQDIAITNLTVGGPLTHRGSYRIWARVWAFQASQSLRFLWSVGELASPVVNDTVPVPYFSPSGNFALVDLGEVRLDKNPLGGHKWTGHIQGMGTANAALDIDQLLLQPLDDGAGMLLGYKDASLLTAGQIAPSVVYSSRDCLLSTDGMFTMTSTGDGYMTMSEVYGHLPRIPTSGLEARPVQLFMRATRGNFGTVPDTNGATDALSVGITYRPSYLFRP